MTFHGYRDKVLQDRAMVAKLAQGEKPRQIAKELGVSYSTLRRRLSRYVIALGCDTPEQVVAKATAEKIKRGLPLALRTLVDQLIK